MDASSGPLPVLFRFKPDRALGSGPEMKEAQRGLIHSSFLIAGQTTRPSIVEGTMDLR
jgi:hypothetical protein